MMNLNSSSTTPAVAQQPLFIASTSAADTTDGSIAPWIADISYNGITVLQARGTTQEKAIGHAASFAADMNTRSGLNSDNFALRAALTGAQGALRKSLPFLPPDAEAIHVGEWLDEIAGILAAPAARHCATPDEALAFERWYAANSQLSLSDACSAWKAGIAYAKAAGGTNSATVTTFVDILRNIDRLLEEPTGSSPYFKLLLRREEVERLRTAVANAQF